MPVLRTIFTGFSSFVVVWGGGGGWCSTTIVVSRSGEEGVEVKRLPVITKRLICSHIDHVCLFDLILYVPSTIFRL